MLHVLGVTFTKLGNMITRGWWFWRIKRFICSTPATCKSICTIQGFKKTPSSREERAHMPEDIQKCLQIASEHLKSKTWAAGPKFSALLLTVCLFNFSWKREIQLERNAFFLDLRWKILFSFQMEKEWEIPSKCKLSQGIRKKDSMFDWCSRDNYCIDAFMSRQSMVSINNILLKPKALYLFTPHEDSEISKASPKLRIEVTKPEPRWNSSISWVQPWPAHYHTIVFLWAISCPTPSLVAEDWFKLWSRRLKKSVHPSVFWTMVIMVVPGVLDRQT